MEVTDFVTFPKYLFIIVLLSLGVGDLVAFCIVPCDELISLLISLCLLNFFLVFTILKSEYSKLFYIVLFIWIANISVLSYYFNTDECLRNEYFVEVLYVLQVLWSAGFLIYYLMLYCINRCDRNSSGNSYIQV